MECVGVNIANFISEECSFVPDDHRKKLEESLEKIIESVKCDYEQKISSLEKSILQLRDENDSDKLIEADLKIANLTEEVKTLQESCKRLENEKQDLQKQSEEAVGKYELLGNMIKNYDLQICHWKEKYTAIRTDLEKKNFDYFEVIDKYMSVKKLEVDYNRRLGEAQLEWEKLTKEVSHRQAEVDNLKTQLTVVKDESKNEIESLKGQLDIKTSELKTCQQCIDELKENIEQDFKMNETLSLKLKFEREEKIKHVNGIEREIREHTKLTQLYKERILDEQLKFGDVAEGQKELLELIKFGEKKYKNLESEFWKIDYNCKKFEENVKKLEKEVENLNEELAKCRSENVARSIDELYPLLGAGRQLLEKDISFTEIMRRYSKASDEIFSLKEENMGLKHAIERIAKEVEAKVPYLKQQKEEYSKALQIINDQVRQIDTIKAAFVSAEDEQKKSDRERQLCESVVVDLSKQVRYLTAQLESSRKGMYVKKMKYSQNNDDGAQVENNFGSIEELQNRNVKLMKKIKIMSEREVELQDKVAKFQQMNEETFLKHQEKYRKLELVVDEYKDISNNLRQQLKVYQNMYKNKLDNKLGDVLFAVPESTVAVQTDWVLFDVENLFRDKTSAEELVKELKERVDTIETDRQECTKQLEELRLDLFQSRFTDSMLRAELEHAKEMFECLNVTKDAFKRQAALLENQCKEYSATLADRDNEIESLKAAVKVEHEASLRQKDSLHQSQREYMALFEKERHLRSKYEQLKECKKTLATVNASIDLMKVNMEKKMTASQEQLGTNMSASMEECSVLRHLLRDKHKELDKLQLEKETEVKLRFELEEKLNNELEVLKLEKADLVSENTTFKNSINNLELEKTEILQEIEKLQVELEARNNELKECIARCEDYKLHLGNLKAELEKHKADASRNDATEELLKEVANLRAKVLKLEEQNAAENVSNEMVEKENKLKSQQEKFESMLELGKQMNVEKELSMHSEAMVELMKDVALKSDEIVKLKAETEKAYTDLVEVKEQCLQKEKDWEDERMQFQQHVSSLDAKNSLLCEQLKMLESQQPAPIEMQPSEHGTVITSETETIVMYESETLQPIISTDEYSEQLEEEISENVEPGEVFITEVMSKSEPTSGELQLVNEEAVEDSDERTYIVDVSGIEHGASVITAPQGIRTSIGRRRTSRRKSNYGKRRAVGAVLEPPILLTIKKKTEETFQVNMPESLVDNPGYLATGDTDPGQDVDDDSNISQLDQHRETMEFPGEHELDDRFDAELEEGDDSLHSEEARDFTVLQPMAPTLEYISELSAPEEIDLTVDRESPPHPPRHVKHRKERLPAMGRSGPSRPARGTGTARRSRGTFKSQRKRSCSIDERPSTSTKVSRRK